MENSSRKISQERTSTIIKYFALAMSMIYVGLGIWFILSADSIGSVPPKQIIILGIIFVFYGFYRVFRIYKKYFTPKI
jgi:hypothetical protein